MSDGDFTVFIVDDDPAVLRALARLLAAAGYRTPQLRVARGISVPSTIRRSPAAPCSTSPCPTSTASSCNGFCSTAASSGRSFSSPARATSRPACAPCGPAPSISSPSRSAARRCSPPWRAPGSSTRKTRAARNETASIEARLARLTPREREVLTHVVAGRLNKQIAGDLGTVEKTIKVHRGRMMSKLGVRTVQDLVRLAERAGIRPHTANGRPGDP